VNIPDESFSSDGSHRSSTVENGKAKRDSMSNMSSVSKALQDGRKFTGAVNKKYDHEDSVRAESEQSDMEQPNKKASERHLVQTNTAYANALSSQK
jgi:hypothetical protein